MMTHYERPPSNKLIPSFAVVHPATKAFYVAAIVRPTEVRSKRKAIFLFSSIEHAQQFVRENKLKEWSAEKIQFNDASAKLVEDASRDGAKIAVLDFLEKKPHRITVMLYIESVAEGIRNPKADGTCLASGSNLAFDSQLDHSSEN